MSLLSYTEADVRTVADVLRDEYEGIAGAERVAQRILNGLAGRLIPTGAPVVEHALGYKSGDMQVRWPGAERIYPLAEWIVDQQQHGAKVYRRTVIVVEDWTEVSRG